MDTQARIWILINVICHVFLDRALTEEYCNMDYFEPSCSDEEFIIMQKAQYGRMKIGKCVEHDLGYIGCAANVLDYFDDQCSGRSRCRILVSPVDIVTKQGCIKGLEKYLEASYMCVAATKVPNSCPSTSMPAIQVTHRDSYISSEDITSSCIKPNQDWKLAAQQGQTLNISIVNMNAHGNSRDIYGTIQNPTTKDETVFGAGPREQHLILSSDLALINLQEPVFSNVRFLLHITVNGCANMEPPEGAWMTRNGNEMEIGCHSGAKSWTMKCENNQWTGSIGQCGENSENGQEIADSKHTEKARKTLSPNAVVFAVCSLVILISSVVFLIGVCLLKGKTNLKPQMNGEGYNVDPLLMPVETYPFQLGEYYNQPDMPIDYKSLQIPINQQ